MKLLVEDAHELENLVEANNGKKDYYIQGTFSTIGEKNRNGRVYNKKLWEDNVSKYQNEIKNNTVKTLGELEHPARVSVDKMKAVMKIVELKIDGNRVVGKAKILNNNSNETNHIKALIDEGMTIGVSSRGTGRMKGDIVEEFQLETYDVVSSPSDYNADLSGIRESVEKEVVLDKKGQYICTDGSCMMSEDETDKIKHDPENPDCQCESCMSKRGDISEKLYTVIDGKKVLIEAKEKYYLLTWYRGSKGDYDNSIGSRNIISTRDISSVKKRNEKAYKNSWLDISEIDKKEAISSYNLDTWYDDEDTAVKILESKSCDGKAKELVEAFEKFAKGDKLSEEQLIEANLKERFKELSGHNFNEMKSYGGNMDMYIVTDGKEMFDFETGEVTKLDTDTFLTRPQKYLNFIKDEKTANSEAKEQGMKVQKISVNTDKMPIGFKPTGRK